MTQFAAILLEAYRELNARKLFWITLGISGIVILIYASIGFDDKGIFFFYGLWHQESEVLKAGSPWSTLLYRSIFSSFIVSLWLAWIATILALISTASIFPEMISSGSIDLMLSKPISRVRLFFSKYIASLLFVILQVGVFCLGAFICMGWRIGEWNWKIFAAVPLVTLLFSYLFSVCVLMGVLTRSTLAALLITLLFWFSLFGGNLANGLLMENRIGSDIQVERSYARINQLENNIQSNADESSPARIRNEASLKEEQIAQSSFVTVRNKIRWWENLTWWIQAPMPKTDDTINLLDVWLKQKDDRNLIDLLSGNFSDNDAGQSQGREMRGRREVALRMENELASQSLWFVLGTSVAFEIVVLSLACLIFARRDF